jgi:diacylglycerol kinase family enzyme
LRLPGGQWLASSAGSRCFLHAATLGLNVEFARLATDASRRAALGSLTYPAASLEALTHLQSIPVRLRLAGVPSRNTATGSPASRWQVTLSTEVLQLAVINTPLFGGTLHLSLPGVDAHDQLLDVFLVEPPNLEKGLETVRALMERLRAPWHWLKPSAERRQEKNNGRNADQEPQTVDVAGEMVFPGVRRYQAREVSIETASPVEMTLDGELFGRTPVRIRVAPARVAVLRPLPAAAPQS